jgi:uncharacterized membrane protein YbhN (UPF0104 family)
MEHRLSRAAVRIVISVGVLVALASFLDAGEVLARLRDLHGGWVLAALAISLPQALALAWRWRFTAGRIGLPLPFRTALAEYYLGNFLNQVLPGGVTGDVSRAWRHARTDAPAGPAVRAVVLERLSGQVVMTAIALASVSLLPTLSPRLRTVAVMLLVFGLAALVGVALRTGTRSLGPEPDRTSPAERLWEDARRSVLAPDAAILQLGSALFTVGTYIAVYLCAAQALRVGTPWWQLAPLVAPVLMTMLLPISVAGWGIREAAAAALWSSVGLSPEDGVAISVGYGLLVLVSTLPGALVLSGAAARGPARRARRRRDGSAGPEDEARR